MSTSVWDSSELLALVTYASKYGQTWEADSEDNVIRKLLQLNRPDDWYSPTNCQREFEQLSNDYAKTCPNQGGGDGVDYDSLVQFQRGKRIRDLYTKVRTIKERYKRMKMLKDKIVNKTITKEELTSLSAERLSLAAKERDEKSTIDDYETATEPSSPYDRESLMTIEKEAEEADKEMQQEEQKEEHEEVEEMKVDALPQQQEANLLVDEAVEVVPKSDLVVEKPNEDINNKSNDGSEFKPEDHGIECDEGNETSKDEPVNSSVAVMDESTADTDDLESVLECEKQSDDASVQKVPDTTSHEDEKDDEERVLSPPPSHASPIPSNNDVTPLQSPQSVVEANHTEEITSTSSSSAAPLIVEGDEDEDINKTPFQDHQSKNEDDSDKNSNLSDSTTSVQVSETRIKEEIKKEANRQQETKSIHKPHDSEVAEHIEATAVEASTLPSTAIPEKITDKPAEDVSEVNPQNEVEIKKEMMDTNMPVTDKDVSSSPINMQIDDNMSIADDQSFTTDHNVTDLNITNNIEEQSTTPTSEQGNKQDLESMKDEASSSKTSRTRRRVKTGKRRLRPKQKQVSSSQPPATPPIEHNSHSEDEDKARRMWKSNTLALLKQISGLSCSDIFSTPVKDKNAPNYSRVIHIPMDLQTIKKKLEIGQITTSESFKHSLIMMVQNAVMYNQYKDPVYNKALELFEEINPVVQEQNKKDRESTMLNTKRAKRAAAKQGEIKTEKMYK